MFSGEWSSTASFSAPVARRMGNQWVGFLDMMDIVKCAVAAYGEQQLTLGAADVWDLMNNEESFQTLTVEKVLGTGKKRPLHALRTDYSLLYAVEMMVREPDLHRVAVIDTWEQRNLKSIVTQSQIIQWVHRHMAILGQKGKPVAHMPNLLHPVVSVRQTDRAIDAFQMMEEINLSGVAVLDQNDRLVDALSIRDLRAMSTDGHLFWRLFNPIHTFLETIRQDHTATSSSSSPSTISGLTGSTMTPAHPKQVVCCTVLDTLETVINMVVHHRVHRVFVVDDKRSMKVVGVITLKDILNELLP